MPEQSTPAKVCSVCHQDCSTRPRLKDKRGRYVCRPCAERLRARRNQAAPPGQRRRRAQGGSAAPSNKQIMNSLVSEALEGKCPHCGVASDPEAIICIHCGYNRETGKAARTEVKEAKPEKRERAARPSVDVQISGTTVFLGLTGLFAALVVATLVWPAFALGYLVALALLALTTMVYTVIAPFLDDDVVWGVLAIASFFIPFIGLAMLYYVFAVSERGVLKAMYGAYLLALLGLIPLLGAVMASLEAMQ